MGDTLLVNFDVRDAEPADAASLAEIYNHYVLSTVATFEQSAVSTSEMAQRITQNIDASMPWLLAEAEGIVVGYAYASKWRSREAYRFSSESTVYVRPGYLRRGAGSMLYSSLLAKMEGRGLHTAIGGIALPNESSVALHERLGFKKVAQFDQVGFKFGRWIDVGYWQKILSQV